MHLKTPHLLIALLCLPIATQSHAQLSEAASHGKTVYEANCAICHKADSTDKTIGPGLKGLYSREFLQDGATKVNDKTVTERIENGKAPMPPFKDSLSPKDISDLVEYLKTL